MSEMRQKDQADFDLETFVDLFDTALTSDNPTVRRAFKNLILVASIVQAEENRDGLANGPLRRLVEDIRSLNRRIGNLESQGAYRAQQVPPGYSYTTSAGTTSISPATYWNQVRATNSTLASTGVAGSLLKKLEEKDES
jgi:hypothetical protein